MMSKDELASALAEFTEKRSALLQDDISYFELNIKRFTQMLKNNPLVQQAINPLLATYEPDPDVWWHKLMNEWSRHGVGAWEFPENADEELVLHYYLTQDIAEQKHSTRQLAWSINVRRPQDVYQTFLTLIIRPFIAELTRKIQAEASIPSQQIRDLQAVPLSRITNDKIKIFLVLKGIGLDPWLDNPEMPAGTNPDRSIKQGFRDSCAVVFFITENFVDERFIADEINNAKIEKRNKGNQFVIITLRFSPNVKVPDLLENYTHKLISNDLEGFYEIMRALPIEMGRPLWKENIVD
ncbi:MAG: toll/interleukin-1 receptor domain-containing protein [Chloroflexota bacterium]